MKKQQFLSFALIAIFSLITLSSCQKEDLIPTAEKSAPYIWIGLFRNFNDCRPMSGMFCIRADNMTEKAASSQTLELDEAIARPVATADGAVQIQAEVSVDQLSPELRRQLLEEKVVVVQEGFDLPTSTLRQAYANADLDYRDQPVSVSKGLYHVDVIGNAGTPPQRIIITITISKDGITITVRW